MAPASSLLSEEHFLCSICLDVFTDPVSTTCGHNYCKPCITQYWDAKDVCQCPLCNETFDKRPKVSVNTFMSELVHQFRHHKWKEEYEAKTEAEIQQMIRERQLRIQEVKHAVALSRKDANREIADRVQVFTALISCIERSQAELIDAIEEKQKTAEEQAEGIVAEMKREISQLKKRSSKLKQLSDTEDHLHHLQAFTSNTPPPTKDWANVNVRQSSYVGTSVAQLEKTLSQEMKKLCDVELWSIQRHAVDVTLDPDTANRWLILSEDGKQVITGNAKRNLPDNTERFSPCPCILGKQSFSSGRFYYEVQVEGKTEWDLGVARESVNRKEEITLRPDNGYWSIWLRNGNEYKALANPHVVLPVREKVQKVGVFVDYEEGLVSFYDVEARVHLYSFTGCTFTEKLYPYFFPGIDNTPAPLVIISPVNMGTGLGGDDRNMSPPTSKRRKA